MPPFLLVTCLVAAGLRAAPIPPPDRIILEGEGFSNEVSRLPDVRVSLSPAGTVSLQAPGRLLTTLRLQWLIPPAPQACYLGDAWERTYGDALWQPFSQIRRALPWYFLEYDRGVTTGWGVQVQPNTLACWRLFPEGRELRLDLRAGVRPLRLGTRRLDAATIVIHRGLPGQTPWQTGRQFCRLMCPNPRLPKEPVYGYNDWYCAYGSNTATNFLADAAYILACAKDLPVRPYLVVDDGWQINAPPIVKASGRGPWERSGAAFGMEMDEFCRRIAALGAKPGLWYRPLHTWQGYPKDQSLQANPDLVDPTCPQLLERIRRETARFRSWGIRLIKADYLTADLNNRAWGFRLDQNLIPDNTFRWRDDTRTTAEVVKSIYQAIRDGAGDDTLIIGCNALNHLAAGIFELQRIGDDTSGKEWARTRTMGVNTLAFRSIQDRTLFAADADCVGLVSQGDIPWHLNRQWLQLLANSGTPLFVSWKRQLATPEVRKALAEAFRLASIPRPTAEPIDWFHTPTPKIWRFGNETNRFNWLDLPQLSP
ncbi:MAG: hypothetical protein ACI4QD_07525 [Kiritimatiellia bacterium]